MMGQGMDGAIAGFDIGGSFISGAVVDADGKAGPLRREANPARDWAGFVATLGRLLADLPVPQAAPVALSLAGVVDHDTGRAHVANIPCLDGRVVARDLAHALGRPVHIANDAACFAVAEAVMGAGRGHRCVFGVILGTGVGGALVVDGQPLHATGGVAGEWGHAPVLGPLVLDDGRVLPPFACGCGQTGCVETVGGARGLERLHQALWGVADADSRAILADWHAGEGRAGRTVSLYIDLVAGPLALVVNVVGAGILPVGGGLAGDGGLLRALDTAVRRRILRPTHAPLLVPAHHDKGDAGVVGAALLARQALSAAPGVLPPVHP